MTEALAIKPEKGKKPIIRRFLALLRKNKDMRRLGLILRAFERRWLKSQNRHKVAVASAATLSKSVHEEILRLTGRESLLTETVDAGLLAGIRITVDDELLIDASAQRQVNRIFAR